MSATDDGGAVEVKRTAIFSFLNVKGCEKVRRFHKGFKAPRVVGVSRFKAAKRKRGKLGARKWRRTVPAQRKFSPPQVSPPQPEEDFAAPEETMALPEEGSTANPPAKEEKIERTWERCILWEPSEDERKANPKLQTIEVEDILAKWLRPHQQEGVRFVAECVLNQRDFEGSGCILADDMGLGKTLQSIVLLYTLLRQGFERGKPAVRRAIVVCPTSLVSNWDNEIKKWLKGRVPVVALTEGGPAKTEMGIADYRSKHVRANVLIISYDTLRRYIHKFRGDDACDLLIADEAHRLKNAKTATYEALSSIACKRRVLLSGTPMQNDLDEFFAMVNFTNPNVIGSRKAFKKYYELPILAGREPDCSNAEEKMGVERSSELSAIVNQFILRRTNVLLSKHLPPKVIEIVCCHMTPLQKSIYNFFVKSKAVKKLCSDGKNKKQVLPLINNMKRLCNHPKLIWDTINDKTKDFSWKGAKSCFPEEFLRSPSHPKHSGKLMVLDKLLMRVKAKTDDRVVLVSNFTQTLDLFEDMCRLRKWGFIRLDGSVSVKNRKPLVDQLGNRRNDKFLFLLSSKAGGCGLNLVGANRLILFDPDWNPAVDKQAAARVWRDGQTKRCFVYRFLATGSIEEKVYQRQLSKEGLANVLGGAATDSGYSNHDLRDLFELSTSASSTHDTLNCNCLAEKENVGGMEGETAACIQVPASRAMLGQRGAPKEEDLINWAHHNTAASVPDPIFREALAKDAPGTGVSFVFTCEIKGRAMPQADTDLAASVSAMSEDKMVITSVAEKKGIEISAKDATARRKQGIKDRKRRRNRRNGGDSDSGDCDSSDSAPRPVRRSGRTRKKTNRLVDVDQSDSEFEGPGLNARGDIDAASAALIAQLQQEEMTSLGHAGARRKKRKSSEKAMNSLEALNVINDLTRDDTGDEVDDEEGSGKDAKMSTSSSGQARIVIDSEDDEEDEDEDSESKGAEGGSGGEEEDDDGDTAHSEDESSDVGGAEEGGDGGDGSSSDDEADNFDDF